MKPTRLSPLHDRLARLRPVWGEVNGMVTPIRFAVTAGSEIELADVSALQRTGLKGPGAGDWLRARGVPVPARPNAWAPLDGGGLVARLARSEFLVEDGPQGDSALTVHAGLRTAASGVYPVLRQDAALLVRGEYVHELFAQTCSIDFSTIAPPERTVTLTMMAGVAVTIIDTPLHDTTCYRIWCDGTYGAYLWDTLLEIAAELGGGAVGLSAVWPDAPVATATPATHDNSHSNVQESP
jgi:sarcosine oxidase subunit gamma